MVESRRGNRYYLSKEHQSRNWRSWVDEGNVHHTCVLGWQSSCLHFRPFLLCPLCIKCMFPTPHEGKQNTIFAFRAPMKGQNSGGRRQPDCSYNSTGTEYLWCTADVNGKCKQYVTTLALPYAAENVCPTGNRGGRITITEFLESRFYCCFDSNTRRLLHSSAT